MRAISAILQGEMITAEFGKIELIDLHPIT
jgi:hypothetical protein